MMTIQLNGEQRQIAPALTLADLLAELSLKSQFVAIEVNRELVPRQEHASYLLQPADQVEIVTLVGGG
jgi:sulfur carrier protein